MPNDVTLMKLPIVQTRAQPIGDLLNYTECQSRGSRAYANYQEFEQVAMTAWNAVCLDEGLVRSASVAIGINLVIPD